MAQPTGDPVEGLLSLGHEIDRLLRTFFASIAPLTTHTQVNVPPVEVLNTPESIVVRVQVPGVKKNDLNLMVHDDALTINGDVKPDDRSVDTDVCQSEFHYGPFSRRIALPAVVQSELTTAHLKEGLLTVLLPKRSETQGRAVPIQ